MTSIRTVGNRAALAATALAMVVASCGGSSSETTTAAPTTAAPAATTTAAPTDTTAATTAAPAETTAAPETTEAPAGNDDLFALGEELFLTTAGGVGCASCHGPEALGNVGPNIQGKTVGDIKTQLDENELMEFLKKALTPEDIEAVALYLKYLKDNASG